MQACVDLGPPCSGGNSLTRVLRQAQDERFRGLLANLSVIQSFRGRAEFVGTVDSVFHPRLDSPPAHGELVEGLAFGNSTVIEESGGSTGLTTNG